MQSASGEARIIVEQITVPARTFRCFKIVEYDEAGIAVRTSWVSDEAKQVKAKSIDHETGEVTELVSYSISQVRT
jgi:hypothetical protein